MTSKYKIYERKKTKKILKLIKGINIEKSLKYFDKHGGWCDCEVLFNVKPRIMTDHAKR